MGMLHTPLCELLGCEYPIIQTAMGWVTGPEIVAASGNAGGFGFLAGATIPPDEIEQEILKTKSLTDAPFGVNFHMYQPNAADIVELVIKHKVRAVSYSRSPGGEMIGRLKEHGVKCVPTIGLPKHAIKAIQLGADAVTVQGGEGGGHTGSVPTSLLIPQVVDAVDGKVPVAAAGGFKDGRGLVAALAWGADGIAMGTRFLMAKESSPPLATKQRYVDCNNPSDIIVSKAVDGLPQRMINNEMLMRLEKANPLMKFFLAIGSGLKFRKFTGASLTSLVKSAIEMAKSDDITVTQAIMSANAPMIIQKAMVDGQPASGVLPSGQVAGVIGEVLSCEEIIHGIAAEAEQRLRVLAAMTNNETRQ
ncbi:MAG: nitronate monooxygenase [Gammaproteobacteria bacterium]|nr:nitronate monooxygenase [Gammaproteobacteria bacterium]